MLENAKTEATIRDLLGQNYIIRPFKHFLSIVQNS